MPRKTARKKARVKKASSQEYAFIDAKKSFTLHVTWEDIKGAKPGDSRNCVLTRAGRREHGCYDIVVWRTVAYVRKTERSIPIRYQVTESAHDQLVAFDASGRSHPITVTFAPMRRANSATYLRSPERKAKCKIYRQKAKKRKARLAAASPTVIGRRRTYTRVDPLTLFGVRNGRGARPPGRGRLR